MTNCVVISKFLQCPQIYRCLIKTKSISSGWRKRESCRQTVRRPRQMVSRVETTTREVEEEDGEGWICEKAVFLIFNDRPRLAYC